jgi:Raf kinase inhibitor-like YbhB/YbcL family protein
MSKFAALLLVVSFLVASLAGCGSEAVPSVTPIAAAPTFAPATATEAPSTPTTLPPTPTTAPPASESPTATAEPPTATSAPPTSIPGPELAISSSAFPPGGTIPNQYSCFGQNLSPPLEWVGVPSDAQSLVLLVDDPDSSPPRFVHWVIYNIPPAAGGLPEGVPPDATLPDGALQGVNDFAPFGEGVFPGGAEVNLVGYDGPCPGGEHRYVFALYVLDVPLDLPAEATRVQVQEAMAGHVLAQAELTGLFAPPGG